MHRGNVFEMMYSGLSHSIRTPPKVGSVANCLHRLVATTLEGIASGACHSLLNHVRFNEGKG